MEARVYTDVPAIAPPVTRRFRLSCPVEDVPANCPNGAPLFEDNEWLLATMTVHGPNGRTASG
jgi:hypothetical protein